MRYWYDTEFIEDGFSIDLISIGIVAEDGREYYAQSNQADFARASEWVQENVIAHLVRNVDGIWKNRATIQADILAFMDIEKYGKPELWGYYSAYDHVAFCQLFGTMMQLPKGFPMYTRDIKQWCDMLGNPKLPEQGKGEHNALADARWNKQAWEFLDQQIIEIVR